MCTNPAPAIQTLENGVPSSRDKAAVQMSSGLNPAAAPIIPGAGTKVPAADSDMRVSSLPAVHRKEFFLSREEYPAWLRLMFDRGLGVDLRKSRNNPTPLSYNIWHHK